MAISVYLDSVFPENNLTGLDPIERAVIAIAQLDMDLNGLQAVAECFRNSARGLAGRAMVGQVSYDQIPDLAERGRTRVKLFFNGLNERLAKSNYIAGDRFTVADITAFISVEFAKVIKEKPSEDAIHLQRWYNAISQRKCAKV
jgi:glutathione S-transferase